MPSVSKVVILLTLVSQSWNKNVNMNDQNKKSHPVRFSGNYRTDFCCVLILHFKNSRRSAWAAYTVILCSCLHSVSKTASGNLPSGGFTQKSNFYLYFGPLQSSSFFFCEVDDDTCEHETSLGLSSPGTSAVFSVVWGCCGIVSYLACLKDFLVLDLLLSCHKMELYILTALDSQICADLKDILRLNHYGVLVLQLHSLSGASTVCIYGFVIL